MLIPFNKPYLTGKEAHYIYQAVYQNGHISGNGVFTKKCHSFFENRYHIKKAFLTHSCTGALEMAAILLNISRGDEVIMPSFTFVSSANAFILRGAKIVFLDSRTDHPNMDENEIEKRITPKTKAIIVVHYAGVACDMDKIMRLAEKYKLFVIEDAAQSVESFYKGTPLGTIGHFGAYSFHETKNVISGEGGMLAVNDDRFIERAEIVWEKGTNRAAFFREEIKKYRWVDVGSSFPPSDIIAAYLFAQLEELDNIQTRRQEIWHLYFEELKEIEKKNKIRLPGIADYAHNNAHMFYLLTGSNKEQIALIDHLKENGVLAVFHYICLHNSPFYKNRHDHGELKYCTNFSNTLVRLPMFYKLKNGEILYITKLIKDFYSR